MLFVQEQPTQQADFTLFLSGSNQVIVGSPENDSFKELKIPDPPILGKLTAGQIQVIKKENRNITCMVVSKDNQYISVTTENKQLIVFDKTFEVVKNIVLSRVSSKVCFSPANDILVADRTGDVYLYKMSHERDEPILLLGHLSVILDMLVTNCGNYIITCDRDEKIRVSHYPNAYNIVTFCLGHTEFVTALKLLECKNVLLSASGDGTIQMWDYLDGKQLNIINTNNLVNEKILDKFASQMDSEKVDVTAVPITSIQIHEDNSKIILAVSLYNVDKLYLYNINSNTLEHSSLGSIDVTATRFSYCLCDRLYILANKLKVYEFIDNKPTTVSYKEFEDKLLEYKDLFVNDNSNDITLLYKRKYDNVQEYMERKKIRLGTK